MVLKQVTEIIISFWECTRHVQSAEKLMAVEISKIDIEKWWRAVLSRDDTQFKKLLKLSRDNVKSYVDAIIHLQRIYKGIKGNVDFKQIIEKDEKTIQNLLAPNWGLYKFLTNKSKSKYVYEDYKLFVYFHIWVDLRHFAFGVNTNNTSNENDKKILLSPHTYFLENIGCLNDMEVRCYNYLLGLMRLIEDEKKEGINPVWEIIQQKAQQCISLGDFYDVFDILIESVKQEVALLPQGFLYQEIDAADLLRIVGVNVNEYKESAERLFIYLNTDLLGFDSLRIVELLRGQPYSKEIQQLYDQYCGVFPELTRNYVFADIMHEQLKSNDFRWESPRLSSCFNIPWNWHQVQKLYDFLRSSNYINKNTDVRNFCHVLIGSIPATSWEIEKIDWTKDKQSLALFIGKLKERDGRFNWKNYPDVFLLNGCDVSFHSSTQFGQALKSGKYYDLLAAIEEAENYIVPKEELID